MEFIDLNIPEWETLGFASEEDYIEYKQNERYCLKDIQD
jgi:hypothetical protein